MGKEGEILELTVKYWNREQGIHVLITAKLYDNTKLTVSCIKLDRKVR